MNSKDDVIVSKNITLFYLIQFFSGLLFTSAIWVIFLQRFMNYTQLATLQSITILITLILQLPTGAFADLVGRKKSIILGWLLSILSSIYLAFSTNLQMVIIASIGTAIGNAFISGADVALLFDSLKVLQKEELFAKIYSRGILLYRLGLMIGFVMGGYLYTIFIGLPYIMRSISQTVTLVIIILMIEPSVIRKKFSFSAGLNKIKDGLGELIKTPHMKYLSLYYVLVGGITWSALLYYCTAFATDMGFTVVQQGWLFMGVYFVSALIMLLITEHKKALNRVEVYIAFPIIMTLFFLPGFWSNKFLSFFILTGVIFAGGSRFAILDGFINQEFDSNHRATALSAMSMLVGATASLIIFALGPIQNIYTTKLVFTILGVISLIVITPSAFFLLQKHKERVI